MTLMNVSQEVVVTSISFGEGNLEISYIEKRDQSDSIGMMKTLFIDTARARLVDQHDELAELAVDMVDAALLALRNPEPVLDPRKRFRNKSSEVIDDDEDL